MQHFNFNENPLNLSSSMQKIIDLNQKTMKKFSYIEPQQLTQIRDPKVLLEKNMEIFTDNSHISLDYMSQLFNIFVNLSTEVGEKSRDFSQQTQSAVSSALHKISTPKTKTAHSSSASHSSRKKASHSGAHASASHSLRKDASAKNAVSSIAKKNNTHKINAKRP